MANGRIHLLEDHADNEVATFRLEDSGEDMALIGALLRDSSCNEGGWKLRLLQVPAPNGQHFVDILEPCIGDFVRRLIPCAPQQIKAAIVMEQGTVVDLPRSADVKHINVAFGWDTMQGDMDLEVAAVLLDQNAKVVNAVYGGNLKFHGIQHSGSVARVGGDNEVIAISLESMPEEIHQVFFVLNAPTNGTSFQQVNRAYCRILTLEGRELCRYSLASTEAGHEQGLLMARLMREEGAVRWGLQAIGAPCAEKTWKESVPDVEHCAGLKPQDLHKNPAIVSSSRRGSKASDTFSVASSMSSGAGGFIPLAVTINSASGVRSADWNGLSDPYCICTVVPNLGSPPRKGSTQAKTKTRMFTLNPVWDETFQIVGCMPGDSIIFTVMDYDMMRSDDYLGSAILRAAELTSGSFEGDLTLSDDGLHGRCPKITGSLKVHVKMQ